MTGSEYQIAALRTAAELDPEGLRMNGVLGMCGETGEVADLLKKHYFQGHPLDVDKLINELGDVMWYIAITAQGLGVSLDQVMELNIQKLRKRYPDGFDSSRSLNRENE